MKKYLLPKVIILKNLELVKEISSENLIIKLNKLSLKKVEKKWKKYLYY